MADTSTSVQVALRIRPLLPSDFSQCKIVLESDKELNQVKIKATPNAFTYDYVFDPKCDQQEVYEKCMKSKIKHLFAGYNLTVLTYGKAGSGKTHTMGTVYNGEDEMGLIPRAVIEIFDCVRDNFIYDFFITVSFMELYQDTLHDLLSDKSKVLPIIREDSDERILIPGLTEISVSNKKDVFDQLIKASQNRATEEKCHAIFTMNLTMVNKNDGTEKRAKFQLVDLASTGQSKTSGKILKEVAINISLLALGSLISALSDGQQPECTPYQASKLTHLLKDSLGGTSITLMMACVSPADCDLEETISTLRYAAKTRKIRNKPVVNLNQDPKVAENNLLKKTVQELKFQVIGQGGGPIEVANIREENVRLQSKIRDLTLQLSSAMNDNADLCEKVTVLQNAIQSLNSQIERYNNSFRQNVLLIHNREFRDDEEDIQRRSLQIQDSQQKIWDSDKDAVVGTKFKIEEMDVVDTSQADEAVGQIPTNTEIKIKKIDVPDTSQADEAAQIPTPVKNMRRRAMCFNEIASTSTSTENEAAVPPAKNVKGPVKSSNKENVDVSTGKPFLDSRAEKRTGGGCSCHKSKCASRVCGCKKLGQKCSSRCTCVCCKNRVD